MNLRDAERMAVKLMREHHITDKGYRFDWDRAVKRFGACHYDTKRITLSKHLVSLNSEEEVRQVILHEIAHAIVGARAGHGRTWQWTARQIGYTGKRTHDAEVPVEPWIGTCPNCGGTLKRHRRKNIACGRCCERYNGGRFTEEYKITWKRNPAATVIASKA